MARVNVVLKSESSSILYLTAKQNRKIQAPGLVFWGEEDTACPVEFANELASDTNARRVLKLNAGHWTIVERSAEVARVLENHWAFADEPSKMM